MLVRTAVESDLDSLVEMGTAMIGEAVVPIPAVNKERVRSILFSDPPPPKMTCLVAENDGGLCGFIVACLASPLFSTTVYCHHHIYYVKPESRGSSAAYRLVKAFEQWGRDNGATLCEIAIDTGLFIERTTSFYHKLGFQTIGAKFIKELKDA